MDTLIKTILDKVAKLPAKRNLMYDVEGFTEEEVATIQEKLAAHDDLHVELTGTKRHPVLEIHPQA
ncbi:hypothetical protein [Levilactobacillus fuyuanensis]|uniref:Uncharacterized protein n=1 Tax=Levilactobacillus fuyuanensis TaxID=2486022 RepID=A0ABW4H6M6_9LACO|nr:hypothetical protein [Levilactobacillus fuyuanensis]